jgi:hypothetical protein
MDVEQLRKQLYAANENRAILYWYIYDELRQDLGEDKATELMQRAIRRRGEEIGEKFAQYAESGDFKGLRDAFIGGIPDESRMFDPKVVRCDEEGLDIEFYYCPLKNAWQKMGLSDEECAKACEIAGIIDYGTFEGAGFDFEMTALPEGSKDCCKLKIRKKAQ